MDHTPRLIGTAIHKILQIISEKGFSFWSNRSEDEKNCYLNALLKQLGVGVEQSECAVSTVLKAIQNTLTDERGRWILHSHQDAKSEYALTAMMDDGVVNLVIDRTFIDSHHTRWIIDYKTTALSQEDLDHFLVKEQKKYAEQMSNYSQVFRASHDGAIRHGLYFPVIPAWYEWD